MFCSCLKCFDGAYLDEKETFLPNNLEIKKIVVPLHRF
jgi:hypothetical protein